MSANRGIATAKLLLFSVLPAGRPVFFAARGKKAAPGNANKLPHSQKLLRHLKKLSAQLLKLSAQLLKLLAQLLKLLAQLFGE
ncbi:MAG: hypothetical protein J6I32_02965 [Bacteroidaceae bacterium]|nr:hypothetical protein [Bacteroidaceae bacterium]